eukprot:gene1538-18275_t
MEIVSAPGWRYPGAPTLVQLNRGEGLLVRAAAPEQLRAENEYWKTYHREKQERLERFKVAVKERVARAAHLKREAKAQETATVNAIEAAAIDDSQYDPRLKAPPEVLRGPGVRAQTEVHAETLDQHHQHHKHHPASAAAARKRTPGGSPPTSAAIAAVSAVSDWSLDGQSGAVRATSGLARQALFAHSQVARRTRFEHATAREAAFEAEVQATAATIGAGTAAAAAEGEGEGENESRGGGRGGGGRGGGGGGGGGKELEGARAPPPYPTDGAALLEGGAAVGGGIWTNGPGSRNTNNNDSADTENNRRQGSLHARYNHKHPVRATSGLPASSRSLMRTLQSDRERALEEKKRSQATFKMCRKLYSEVERNRVRVKAQQRAAMKGKMQKLKEQAEKRRLDEEVLLKERAAAALDAQPKTAEQVAAEELEAEMFLRAELAEAEREAAADFHQHAQEMARYVEALRHSVAERLAARGVSLPRLCSCGGGFWETRPETCANNCRFYANPKKLAHALTEMLHMYTPLK